VGEDANPEEHAEEAPDPEIERLAKKDRSVRRRVLLTVAPLIPTLLIPWPPGFSWEMNDRVDTIAFVAIPLIALIATVVALMKKRSLLVRNTLLGALGLAAVWVVLDVATSHQFIRSLANDIKRLDAYALYLGLFVPILALALELVAALDRRSRFRASLAGLGWMGLVAGYFLPMRSDRVESMPFLLLMEAIDDAGRHEEYLIVAIPVTLLLLTALGAAAYTLLRLLGDSDQRERWRPRTGCVAFFIGTPPALLLFALATWQAIEHDPEMLGLAWNAAAWVLGFWVGLPVLLASGIDGLIDFGKLTIGDGEPHLVKRTRIGLAAAGLIGIVLCLAPLAGRLLPDSREGRAAEELHEIAGAIVDSSMGGELDPRFIGGYSEYDLRGSSGVLREAIGQTEPTLLYATFEIVVLGDVSATIEVGVDDGSELAYLGGSESIDSYPPEWALRQASEPLADLTDRMRENMTMLSCLPASAPPSLPGLVDRRATIPPLCRGSISTDQRRRIRDIGRGGGDGSGGTGAYRVWVRSGSDVHRLEGRLFSHEGRLWIGRAALDPEAAP